MVRFCPELAATRPARQIACKLLRHIICKVPVNGLKTFFGISLDSVPRYRV